MPLCGSAGGTPFAAFRASSRATSNGVKLLLAAPALDLTLSTGCLMLVRISLGVEKLRTVLAHAMVQVGSDARVELSPAFADVYGPHRECCRSRKAMAPLTQPS